jgi:acyl-lipid omega-6 desaturase (Delta-12 desaturase)
VSRDGTPATDESWRALLAPHMKPRLRPALLDVATSIVAYLALMATMFAAFRISYLVVLALAIPAAGFMVRTFIVFHDCAHGSFVRSKRVNATLGAVLGVVLYTPFAWWRHEHAVHHATTGDLDKRGIGDIQTLTVDEYRARSWPGRFQYRLFRNPFVMFVFGPLWVLLISQRLITRDMRPRLRNSVLGTDLALALLIGALVLLVGWKEFLLVQGPPLLLAGAVGIWLFYVQHQFEDAYWQTSETWSFEEAALQGSSHLELPRILRFFTGNIGLHHVHHLSARIPNYNLQNAHDAGGLESVTTLSLRDGIRAVRLKLWDQDQHRLVTFREAARARRFSIT